MMRLHCRNIWQLLKHHLQNPVSREIGKEEREHMFVNETNLDRLELLFSWVLLGEPP